LSNANYDEDGVINIHDNYTDTYNADSNLPLIWFQPKRRLRNLTFRNNYFRGRGRVELMGYGDVFDATAVNTATDRITADTHGMPNATRVLYKHDADDVGGITDGTEYYVKSIDANTIELYTDEDLTSIVDLTTTGTGWGTLFVPFEDCEIVGNTFINTKTDTASLRIRMRGNNVLFDNNIVKGMTLYGVWVNGDMQIVGNKFVNLDPEGKDTTVCIYSNSRFSANIAVFNNIVIGGTVASFIQTENQGFPVIEERGNIVPSGVTISHSGQANLKHTGYVW
jgi:hypothetical protein